MASTFNFIASSDPLIGRLKKGAKNFQFIAIGGVGHNKSDSNQIFVFNSIAFLQISTHTLPLCLSLSLFFQYFNSKNRSNN